MANVSMDLNELKALENKIEKLEADKKYLEDTQQQVVIYHKYFKGRLKAGRTLSGNYLQITGIKDSYRGSYGATTGIDPFIEDVKIEDLFNRGLIEVDVSELSERTSKDYKNLSEVQEEIRQEEINKVQSEIKRLTKLSANNEEKLIIQADKYETTIGSIKQSYEKDKKDIKDSYEKKLEKDKEKFAKIQKDFDNLKADKKTKSLEEQLKELKEKIEEQDGEITLLTKKVPWWRK